MNQARRRILVVEHDAPLATKIANDLEALGHDVLATTGSIDRALAIAAMSPPDVVLLDVHLNGDVDAIQAAALLRAQRDVPIVLITADDEAMVLHRVKNIEPLGHVSNHASLTELRTVVEIAWHKHQGAQRLQAPLTPLSIERAMRDQDITARVIHDSSPAPSTARAPSVSWLAASVAHEINNPLAAALISLEVTQNEIEKLATTIPALAQESISQGIHDAAEACRRIRDIVANLRSLSDGHHEQEPLHAVSEAQSDQPEVTPSARVLLIDDDVIVANTIERALRDLHTVTAVASGSAALKRLAAGETYDVILCDLMMPAMTGMDLHAALSKSHPRLAANMVFMTGGAFTSRAQAFLDAIPNVRLEKPFRREALLRVIQRALGKQQQHAA